MIKLLKSIFEKPEVDVKIFAGAGPPMPNFQILATHVRHGQTPQNFILDGGSKLESIIEKWRFRPGGEVGRCGYDYQIMFTNGDLNISISICFFCKILIVNHLQVYKISKRQILNLLKTDFRPL